MKRKGVKNLQVSNGRRKKIYATSFFVRKKGDATLSG
jgi:hypothetical protein